MSDLSSELIEIGIKRLESLGFNIQFGKHANNKFLHMSGTVKQRLEDLEAAFSDPMVCGVMAVFGGYNTSDLLGGLSKLSTSTNKWIIGYSDITALLLPLINHFNIQVIHGPGFASFCDPNFFSYSSNAFLDAIKGKQAIYKSPDFFSSDKWYLRDKYGPRVIHQPCKWHVYSAGKVLAPIIGGNLDTLCTLIGTPYFPEMKGKILFLEETTGNPGPFQRGLIQLRHLGVLDKIAGLIIGKFPVDSAVNDIHFLTSLISTLNLPKYPVLLNVHCSHVDPMLSIPLNKLAKLVAVDQPYLVLNYTESAI